MFPLRRTFTAVVVAGTLMGGLRAAEFKLPPISGDLAGKFRTHDLPGAPEIAWKLHIDPTRGATRHVDAQLTANGARLQLKADLDAATGDGTWEIGEGELDAAAWLVVLAPQLGGLAKNTVAGGKIALRGGGVIKDGQPSGKVSLVWQDGSLRNAVQNWTLEGVTLKGDLWLDAANVSAMRSNGPWDFSVKTISSARFGARNLFVSAQFNGNGTVSLLSAHVELAGGDVTVDPTTVALFPPVLDFTVHVNRIGLQDLVALVPASIADARGRIDGVVRLGWSKAAGIQIGAGHFDLWKEEVATLTLASAPGFLTHRVPEKLALLPNWTGPLGKWLATPNPVYQDVSDIELGRSELQIVSFGLKLTPRGDDRGRTGVVQISARQTKAERVVKLVSFEVNIFGSVSALLKHSMVDEVSFQLK